MNIFQYWARIKLLLAAGFILAACNKSDQEIPSKSAAGIMMPVSIIQVQPTNAPISVESVAQTEGAKEVEIRPRVGVFYSNVCMKKVPRLGRANQCF